MKHKKNKDWNFYKTFTQSLKLIVPKTKTITFLFLVTGILYGLVSTGVSLVIKYLIDALNIYSSDQSHLDSVIQFLIILFIAGALNHYLQMFFDASMNYFHQKTEQLITEKISEKCHRLPHIAFEVNETYDIIKRANDGKTGVPGVLAILCFIAFLLSRVVSSAIYFYFNSPLLVLTLIIATIPVFIAKIVRGKTLYSLQFRQSPKNRLLDYYDKCITDSEYFKETRLLNIEGYFIDKWNNLYEKVRNEEWKVNLRLWFVQFLMLLLKSLGLAGSFAVSAFLLYSGKISIGLFSMTINLMFFLQWTIEHFFEYLGKMTEDAFKAKNFFILMEQREDEGIEKKKPFRDSIIIDNISFKYPYSNQYAIRNISLKIKKGEKIAFVGVNGSGKTTLVKLISGLYTPDKGSITYNSQDLRKIYIDEKYTSISGVFQDFSKYYMTVRENIGLSEIKRMQDDESIQKSLQAINLSLEKETKLGREFGGTELSGGEWQKLAIARGIFREHEIIILDEPTASIDPLLEASIYDQFIHMSEDKTAIIVTHRLGSTKIADRIILLENGTIIETGNHTELIALDGKYAEIYKSQAEWYNR